MSQCLLQVRVDDQLKREVSSICETMGLDLSTVIRLFMQRIRLEKGIPFDLKIPAEAATRYDGMLALDRLREQTSQHQELTLDEINEEISSLRAGK